MAAPTSIPSHNPNPTRKVAFISGPLEPNPTYFTEYYAARIDHAIAAGHDFVVAASCGIDTLALVYLLERISPMRVTVFLSLKEAEVTGSQKGGGGEGNVMGKARFKKFEEAGGRVVVAGRNHTERDAAMTQASHYDILRYRTEEECRALYGSEYRKRVSGTELNEQRRAQGVGLVWGEQETTTIESK